MKIHREDRIKITAWNDDIHEGTVTGTYFKSIRDIIEKTEMTLQTKFKQMVLNNLTTGEVAAYGIKRKEDGKIRYRMI